MMKIQSLAVIFIIIILPISLILSEYCKSEIETLNLQISYDNKLNNATYDALKTFQLNTINSSTSNLANSKLSDIEASASIFFRSIANNFNMVGYNQDILKEYVPALVYTMYDGYYIYSPYTNTLDDRPINEIKDDTGKVTDTKSDKEILEEAASEDPENVTYKDGDKVSGLKPYIFYSCRYKYYSNGGMNDIIITYSLDNYITIQGMINGKFVYDSGYLLDNIGTGYYGVGYSYRGVSIPYSERLQETIYNPDIDKKEVFTYIKINGVKYYCEPAGRANEGKWFSIVDGKKYYQPENFSSSTPAAYYYYKEAQEFTQRVRGEYGLSVLTGEHAVDENTGSQLYEKDENGNNTNQYKLGNYKIFEESSEYSIEDPESNFNQQRLAVIRYAIEKNLSIAINNYNKYAGEATTTNFQMPKLKEDEWDKIVNNVSIISFLQGLNIGGKVYNGYSIITNNKNKEVVDEDSIYIVTRDNEQYHKANDKDLLNTPLYSTTDAVLNLDFEIKSVEQNGDGNIISFLPRKELGCYSSIITQSNLADTGGNFYKYMKDNPNQTLAQAYFTALGRERYSMYKLNNNADVLKQKFIQH